MPDEDGAALVRLARTAAFAELSRLVARLAAGKRVPKASPSRPSSRGTRRATTRPKGVVVAETLLLEMWRCRSLRVSCRENARGFFCLRCSPARFEGNLFQAYVLKSAYFYQLLPWLLATEPGLEDPFGPNRRLHVATLERFDAAALQRLLDFLELERLGPAGYVSLQEINALVAARRNATARPRPFLLFFCVH